MDEKKKKQTEQQKQINEEKKNQQEKETKNMMSNFQVFPLSLSLSPLPPSLFYLFSHSSDFLNHF